MPRVYEIARELGVSSKEVIEVLARHGQSVPSHASSIDEFAADALRDHYGKLDGRPPKMSWAEPQPAATGSPAVTADGSTEVAQTDVLARRAERKAKRSRFVSHLTELPILVFFAFAIAVLIKTFLVQAFYIPSGSMIPTLRKGDRVLVEKVTYFLDEPSRGDVVVFERDVFGEPADLPWFDDTKNFFRELLGLPTGQEEDYIKRVVAVGGDTIRYAGTPRTLYVNGDAVPQPFIHHGKDPSSPTLTSRDCRRLHMAVAGDACRVPAGRIFVMGDNRGDSEDSRIIGPVEEDRVVGKAFVLIWPPDHLGTL